MSAQALATKATETLVILRKKVRVSANAGGLS
jgi:hypothetical protein